MREARDAFVVAAHELGEALRSKRVLILALLYVGGAVAGTLGFIEMLRGLEAGLSETLAVAQSDKPGAFTTALMESEEFIRILARLIRDEALARELASIPPLSLFYGFVALTFCPALVMLTSSEAVAHELSSGAIRFSLVRTDRLSYSAGKLLGQSLLMAVSVFAGALGVWVTGLFAFEGFAPLQTALWLAALSARALCYCFAYAGIALGLSHLTRSVPLSRALGLGGLIGLGALYGLAHADWVEEHAEPVASALLPLLPRAHQLDLWRPELGDRLPAMVMLLALGLLYFALGYLFRARRDA